MRRSVFGCLITGLLLLGACTVSPEGEGGAVVSGETPTTEAAGQPAIPDEILIFTREGGIAGFCDTLTVSSQEAQWQDCVGGTATMPLEEETQNELLALAEQYSAFEEASEDNPGGADSMHQSIRFNGVGEQPVTDEVEARLIGIATEMLGQLMQVGATPTR